MAGSSKSPAPDADIVWRRLATPRETMFGLRSDGTSRSTCSNLEIISSVEIKHEVLERCAEHFNRDMGCFHEFLMENEESKDIWLVKAKENCYMVLELEDEEEINTSTIEDEINCQLPAEDCPSWKLYCNYVGYEPEGGIDAEKYPYIYQLIFVFSTGTLDEFSCALICDLFLNILDCALKDVPFQCYSHLNMYDVGSKLEDKITGAIQALHRDEKFYKSFATIYRSMLDSNCSNFDFKEREFENKDTHFRTMRCLFSRDETQAFLNICKVKNVGIYAVFIVIINNTLLRHAMNNGFEGQFRTRVLHIINARFVLNREDMKYTYKLGSHHLPYMQLYKLESDTVKVKEIFKEARIVETHMGIIITNEFLWKQEATRELFIKESGLKYSSGKWNPHYCFSVTNMGNLDFIYSPESPNNKFRVLTYERASKALEGGHLDVIFHIFNGRLNVHFDFSNKYFSDNEMLNIIGRFTNVVEVIVQTSQ